MLLAVNFIAFQLGWLGAVLGAANGMPWLGPLLLVIVLGVHLRLAANPVAEIGIACAAAIIGVWFDSLLVAAGYVAYPSGQWHPALAPYWIVAMWVLFATTLNVSLRWLRRSTALAVLFGAVGGPLSYLAGERLGGIEIVDTSAALLFLAVGWAAALPLLISLAVQFESDRQTSAGEFA